MRLAIFGFHHACTAVTVKDNRINSFKSYSICLNVHALTEQDLTESYKVLLRKIQADLRLKTKLSSDIKRICISTAGIMNERAENRILKIFRTLKWDLTKIHLIDDTIAGLFGGSLSNTGICAYSGIGASVFVCPEGLLQTRFHEADGKPYKLDGWGPIIGDLGSGFQITVNAFKRIGRLYDKGDNSPELLERIIDWTKNRNHSMINLNDIMGVQNWFDALYTRFGYAWRHEFARISEVVLKYSDGPEVIDLAREITEQAAIEFAETILISLELNGSELEIVLQGEVMNQSLFYRQTVINHVRKVFPLIRIANAQYTPLFGTVLSSCSDTALLPAKQVVDSLRQSVNEGDEELQRMMIVNFK